MLKMKKAMFYPLVCFLFCSLFISGCLKETSSNVSTMIYVDHNGGADYIRIQDAIDASVVNSTIFVANGTYHETLTIDKSLTIVGSGQDNTTIAYDGKKINAVDIISINADNCKIKFFKIINTNSSTNIKGITINSNNNTISNTSISKTTEGICIEDESTNNTIFQNNITNNEYGIKIKYASFHNYISNNIISSNTLYGIYSQTGSGDNIISWNTISYSQHGIRLKGSTHNKIFGNTAINNQRGFFLCCGATGNEVYYNEFINNSEWNAEDSTRGNPWNNETIGNYWDDHNGIDTNDDGISETYYSIPGGNSRDNYPLMNPGLK